jgi:hypothetical protein
MRTVRIATIALIVALLATLLTAPGQALAASWTYSTDFTAGFPVGWVDMQGACEEDASGVTNVRPAVASGFGDGHVLSSQYGRKLAVYLEFDEPVTVTHLGLIADLGSGDSTSNYVAITACEDDRVTTHVVYAGDTTQVTIDEDVSWADVLSIGIFTAPASGVGACMIDAEAGFGTTPPCHYAWVDEFTVTVDATDNPFDGIGGGEGADSLLRPVRTADTLEVDETTDVSFITAIADSDVHAAADGVITAVLATGGAYMVTVESTDYSARYSNLANIYGQIGDEIVAGCVLGRVGGQMFDPTGDYEMTIGQIGFRINDDLGDPLAWQAWPDPTGVSACADQFYTGANCLTADPLLDGGAARWATDGYQGDGTVILDPGETLRQSLVLTANTDYYLTVIATTYASQFQAGAPPVPEPSVITVTLGDTADILHFSPKDVGNLAVDEIGPLTVTTPDQPPDVYNLVLTVPNYSEPVLITFVCLHTGTVLIEPEACYLADHDFATGDAAWTLSTGAIGNYPVEMSVTLPQDEYISQPMLLTAYDEADAEYYLRVIARTNPWELAITYNDWLPYLSGDYETTLTVTYDVASVPVETLGEFTILNVLFWNPHQSTFTIPDDETWDGDLVATNTSAAVRHLDIGSICIEPVSGVWPGFENADSQTPTECPRPIMPGSFVITEWIAYAVGWLTYLWYCIIAQLWNGLLVGVGAMVAGLGMLGRWLGSLVSLTVAFAAGLIAGGLQAILNSLASLLAVIWGALAALPLFRLGLDLLGFLFAGLGLLAAVIQSLLGLLVGIANFIAAATAMLIGSFSALIGFINSASAPDVGMPNCGNPSDPLIGICYGVVAVIQAMTIFDASIVGISVIAGCIGIFTFVWTSRVLGDVLGDI